MAWTLGEVVIAVLGRYWNSEDMKGREAYTDNFSSSIDRGDM